MPVTPATLLRGVNGEMNTPLSPFTSPRCPRVVEMKGEKARANEYASGVEIRHAACNAPCRCHHATPRQVAFANHARMSAATYDDVVAVTPRRSSRLLYVMLSLQARSRRRERREIRRRRVTPPAWFSPRRTPYSALAPPVRRKRDVVERL